MSFFESWLCRERVIKTLPTNPGPPAGTCRIADQWPAWLKKGMQRVNYMLRGAGPLIVMNGELCSPGNSLTGVRIQMSCILWSWRDNVRSSASTHVRPLRFPRVALTQRILAFGGEWWRHWTDFTAWQLMLLAEKTLQPQSKADSCIFCLCLPWKVFWENEAVQRYFWAFYDYTIHFNLNQTTSD